jgi:cytochrome c oxidase subunit 4
MDNHENHITSYFSNAKVLVALLFLTFVTVAVTSIEFGMLTVAVALAIACIKAYIVLTYFMHLKYEAPIFRIMVIAVFILFALIIGLTFFDYAFR